MPITQVEANQVAARIQPIFQKVLNTYDYRKYPEANYNRFRQCFSALNPTDDDIELSMVWKWGHWGKLNYPQRHINLIIEIQTNWPKFVLSGQCNSPKKTFEWWLSRFGRRTTYITASYITHLVHHELPIIDQHNFRAMNSLIRCLRVGRIAKKRPSNWSDIQQLNEFMSLVVSAMPNIKISDLDKFLMMYGRNYAAR